MESHRIDRSENLFSFTYIIVKQLAKSEGIMVGLINGGILIIWKLVKEILYNT